MRSTPSGRRPAPCHAGSRPGSVLLTPHEPGFCSRGRVPAAAMPTGCPPRGGGDVPRGDTPGSTVARGRARCEDREVRARNVASEGSSHAQLSSRRRLRGRPRRRRSRRLDRGPGVGRSRRARCGAAVRAGVAGRREGTDAHASRAARSLRHGGVGLPDRRRPARGPVDAEPALSGADDQRLLPGGAHGREGGHPPVPPGGGRGGRGVGRAGRRPARRSGELGRHQDPLGQGRRDGTGPLPGRPVLARRR